MGKDPAFLFYSDNFLTGTMFFTDEQVGKYIRLLCAQHLTGHLNEKDMLLICKTHDSGIWSKFLVDGEGKFYNERLENEIFKRRKYTESRSKNKLGKTKTDKVKDNPLKKSYDNHMGNGNGIGNINGDENENKGGAGGKLTRDEQLAVYEKFTNDILAHNDQLFEQLALKDRVDITEDAVKDHLALLNRYPNMQPLKAAEFRQSLIKHCKDFKLKKDVPTKPRRIGTIDVDEAERELKRHIELDEQIRAQNFTGT
jgi:uncharacterized protein YdaU (DUF1376 family)